MKTVHIQTRVGALVDAGALIEDNYACVVFDLHAHGRIRLVDGDMPGQLVDIRAWDKESRNDMELMFIELGKKLEAARTLRGEA